MAELNLDLRDRLAIERTALANKRTFLAVVRTSLTIAVLAFSLLKLFPGTVYTSLSIILLIASVITLSTGTRQYFSTKINLINIESETPQNFSFIRWANQEISLLLHKLSFVHLKVK